MGELSENIKATFSNLLQIYEETADMFLDADDLMIRNGHRVLKGSALESGTSKSLDSPRWWATFSGVRYYVPDDDPLIAKSIGVFFMDSRLEPMDPIIVYSCMHAVDDEDEDEISPYWVIWDAWFKNLSDRSLDVDHTFPSLRKVAGGKIRALLLEEINDRQQLEDLVISQLLGMDWR